MVVSRRKGVTEVREILALLLLPGLGPVRLSRFLTRFGSPAAVLEALRQGRATLRGEVAVPAAVPAVLGSAAFTRRIDAAEAVLDRLGAEILLRGDERLPEALWELPEPPVALFACGRMELLEAARVRVAVVGTRQPTEYGRDAGWLFAEGLASSGVVVVSGLARGIDGIAHAAALEACGGTVAVLGCGLDVSYPREHERLQGRIAREGLVLTEYAPGVGPRKHHFRFRNRLIAALSRGVLVVEGGRRSGALITAEIGLDLGLHVFGVPGLIGRPASAGVNELIRDGAGLATDPVWVAQTCGLTVAGGGAGAVRGGKPDGAARGPFGAAGRVFEVLSADARHVDEVAAQAELPAGEVLAALLDLEVRGLARRLPGSRFALPRVAQAEVSRGTTAV